MPEALELQLQKSGMPNPESRQAHSAPGGRLAIGGIRRLRGKHTPNRQRAFRNLATKRGKYATVGSTQSTMFGSLGEQPGEQVPFGQAVSR